jgi:tetrahedral aminopeptidase
MDASRVSFLQQMIASPSPSGFEQPLQQLVREEIQHYTDTVRTDVHGNVIAALNPEAQPRVMLTAHSDELGFLIRYIDDNGFLYFAPIGGFDPSTLPGNRVQIQTPAGPVLGVVGRPPIHMLSDDERGKAPKLSDLWIDIGASSKEEAARIAPVGSVATRAAQLEHMQGDLVVSRALDDKSGVFTVIEAMRRIHTRRSELNSSVFFVSAVQEEVGSRGARTAAHSINPLIAIAVDVTYTSDHPNTSKQELGEIKLNGGPVLTIGGNVNPRVYQLLVQAAQSAGLAWQIDPQAASTYTDTDVIQVAREGIATGLVSIPCRYLHTGSEIASLKDMDEVAELLTHFVLSLNNDTNIIP